MYGCVVCNVCIDCRRTRLRNIGDYRVIARYITDNRFRTRLESVFRERTYLNKVPAVRDRKRVLIFLHYCSYIFKNIKQSIISFARL